MPSPSLNRCHLGLRTQALIRSMDKPTPGSPLPCKRRRKLEPLDFRQQSTFIRLPENNSSRISPVAPSHIYITVLFPPGDIYLQLSSTLTTHNVFPKEYPSPLLNSNVKCSPTYIPLASSLLQFVQNKILPPPCMLP